MSSVALHREFGFKTTSDHKVKEAHAHFSEYGIHIEKLDPTCDDKSYLLTSGSRPKFIVMGIIEEYTNLVNALTGTQVSAETAQQMEPVIHNSKLILKWYNKKTCALVVMDFISQTEGYIDLTRRSSDLEKYNWDDIFVVRSCHRSYVELNKMGQKISPRDKNLDLVIKHIVHYEKPVDLAHLPQGYIECNDFSRDIGDYLASVPEFNTSFVQTCGYHTIMTYLQNQGVSFRAPQTRRQKLNWCPGLVGIPLTAKPKDPHHELAYQAHDMAHMRMFDLMPDGKFGRLEKLVYIAYRLMSECSTLVFADMMFVWSMKQSGFDYKTAEMRKIYPVFEQIVAKEPTFADNLEPFMRQLLTGSYEHCFYGKDEIWRNMMADPKPLESFSGKYDAYFMADFQWTLANYENMAKNPSVYEAWWNRVKEWRKHGHNFELQSISEFIEEFRLDEINGSKNIIDAIWNAVYSKFWYPVVSGVKLDLLTPEKRFRNRFIRYMIGQAFVCFKTPHWESRRYLDQFEKALDHSVLIDLDHVKSIRYNYFLFLNELARSSLITFDDSVNFYQNCPIFPPVMVDYDHDDTYDQPIGEFVQKILNM
jgi:hypothetical protein